MVHRDARATARPDTVTLAIVASCPHAHPLARPGGHARSRAAADILP